MKVAIFLLILVVIAAVIRYRPSSDTQPYYCEDCNQDFLGYKAALAHYREMNKSKSESKQ